MGEKGVRALPPLVTLLLVSLYITALIGVASFRESAQTTQAEAEAIFAESDARSKSLAREVKQEQAVAEAWERRIAVLETRLEEAGGTP
jgi:hypothetical protein